MFDMLKNLGNLGDIMKKAKAAQDRIQAVQDELARKQVTADSGAGMVTATCNGKMELISLKIDKSKVDPNDVEMLEDLVTAAVRAAQALAADLLKQEMQKAAGDLGLPPGFLPGM